MEYQPLSLDIYQQELIPKVMRYINTRKVRKMKLRTLGSQNCLNELNYGDEFESGSKISFNHLLSVWLFTDYTNLCTDFSKSFRASNAFESLTSTKARNAAYFWLSKYLRQCVELYGDYDGYFAAKSTRLIGPFY